MSSRSSKPSCASLYVRNVPDGARIDELKSIFGKYGIVSDVYIPLDYYTRRPRGFAYIQFDDQRDAEEALYNVHHIRYYGVELEVEFARSDRKTPSTMRAKDRERGAYSPPRRSRRDDDDYDRRRRDRSYSRSPDRSRRDYSRSRSRSGHRRHDGGSSKRRSRSRSYSRRR